MLLREDLKIALVQAFPGRKLEMFVSDKLSENLYNHVEPGAALDVAFRLIEWIGSMGRLGELIEAARQSNPNALRNFISSNLIGIIDAIYDTDLSKLEIPKEKLIKLVEIIQQDRVIQVASDTCIAVLPDSVQCDRGQEISDLKDSTISPQYKAYILLLLLNEYPIKDRNSVRLPRSTLFIKSLSTQAEITSDLKKYLQTFLPKELRGPAARKKLGKIVKSSFLRKDAPLRKDIYLDGYLQIKISLKDKIYLNSCLQHDELGSDAPLPIDLDESVEEQCQKGITCTDRNLEERVARLIEKGVEKLKVERSRREKKMGLLIVEFFLPYQYLFEKFDRWSIELLDEKWPIGSQYGIILRSLDRLEKGTLYSQLNESWQRLVSLKSNSSISRRKWIQSFLHIEEHDDASWGKISEKIGVKLTCGLPEDETAKLKLARQILLTHLPFAIWTRRRLISEIPDLSKELDKLLKIDHFRDTRKLLESIQEVRKEACHNPQAYLGGHLAFLYDDPDRPFPDSNPLN